MYRIFLFTFASVAMLSCSTLKDSPKYKLTDGVYKTKIAGQKMKVYIENEEDSVLVYQLSYPSGIAIDGQGNLYIADQFNHRVQKWAPGAVEGGLHKYLECQIQLFCLDLLPDNQNTYADFLTNFSYGKCKYFFDLLKKLALIF